MKSLGSLALALLLLASASTPLVRCMDMDFPMMTPYAVARTEDIPFIECEVCKEVVGHIVSRVETKRQEIAPNKLGELEIIDIVEKVCDMKRENGEWIKYLDIVEKGSRLKLEHKDFEGECLTKCKTIHKTCLQIVGDHDTDISEFIYQDKPQSELLDYVCKDLNKACAKKPPPLPKNRKPLEPFTSKRDRSQDMAEFMKKNKLKSSVSHDLNKFDDPELDRYKHGANEKRHMNFDKEL